MRPFLIVAGAAILSSGCGGGGSSASEGSSTVPAGTENNFGPISTRGQINGQPIVRDLGRIATVALAGTLTDATYRPQGTPDNETAIAVATGNGNIEFYMETGEKVATIRPDGLDPRNYAAYPQWSADGQKIYFLPISDTVGVPSPGIQSFNVTNPATTSTVLSATGVRFFRISPDETKIAYTRIPTSETDLEVFVRGIAGGSTTRLTTNDDSDIATSWIDENDRLAIQTTPSAGVGNTVVRQLSTGDTVEYENTSATDIAPVGRDANGEHFLNFGVLAPENGGSVTQRYSGDLYGATDFTLDLQNRGIATISPDNTRWSTVAGQAVFTTERFPQTATQIAPTVPVGYIGAAWQPALGVTKFVGASGRLGTTSAGIIATNRSGVGRRGLASFVNWDCQTRSTSTISDDATELGTGTKTYVIEADRLTALRYANRPLFVNVATVSSSGTANGAIVTLDTENGLVASIVIFQETRGTKPSIRREGASRVIEGSIVGVWDAKGKNLAPSGANRVTIGSKGEASL